jgi:hypothetical protein
VGEVPGMRDVAAGKEVDDCSLVTVRVAVPAVGQSYDVLLADPYAADPAGLGKKGPGGRQASDRQRSQQRRVFDGRS